MIEGKIIKHYRRKANMTQDQLGQGICSATHISKIERGLTEYATEIIDLLSERLQIHMNKEIRNLTTIKEKLDLWLEMIISQNIEAATEIEEKLDNNPLIQISEYQTLYLLLKLMHHLKISNLEEALKYKNQLPKNHEALPDFEKNLYSHVLGVYYMAMQEFLKSIEMLKSIDFDSYSNPMVYHDLATAYHHHKSPVLSYYYAETALSLYKKRNNFLGIIDTENLMAIQIESDHMRDFRETVEQYESLIVLCDLCHDMDKKAKILHNYAYENLRRKNYLEAKKLYKESMTLKERKSGIYLLSLEGYIRCAMEGQLLTQYKLLELIHEGLDIAEEINEKGYGIFLTILKYALLDQKEQYFSFISNKALPYFNANGYIMIAQRYQKELFKYYHKIGDHLNALKTASQLINNLGNE